MTATTKKTPIQATLVSMAIGETKVVHGSTVTRRGQDSFEVRGWNRTEPYSAYEVAYAIACEV